MLMEDENKIQEVNEPQAAPQIEEQIENKVSDVQVNEGTDIVENTEPAVTDKQEEPKWYILQTLTGQEGKVKERIENGIAELNLGSKVPRVLVPEEETVEIKGDKRIERKRKMYPGYVFIEASLDNEMWYVLKNTTGVARFIGGSGQPQAVTDREMQRVLKQLGIKEKEYTIEFTVGENIRIISGSFRGYTGSISEINAPKSKLKAMINIFGRDTSVEVDFDRVEKII